MKFLSDNECARWCEGHGFPSPQEVRSRSGSYEEHRFTIPGDAGHRVSLCRELWSFGESSPATERLLWIRGWSVWPSAEHMPLFLKWRASFGETRDLKEIPGLLCGQGDDDDGLSAFIISGLFLWDCWMYCGNGIIVELSHDEVGSVYEPPSERTRDIRGALERFGVLMNHGASSS